MDLAKIVTTSPEGGGSIVPVESIELTECVATIAKFFHGVFDELEVMRSQLVEAFAAGPSTSTEVGKIIEPLAREFLKQDEIVGAGFVAGPNALTDRKEYLAWWQGENKHLLAHSSAAASGDPLDYTRQEWFKNPMRTGERHITGPYVDFVCTDEYVMTSTAPVVVGTKMYGVVGADTFVETLETMLVGPLSLAGPRTTLVNHAGRAIASADPRIATGTLLDLGSAAEKLACRDLPLSVLTPRYRLDPGDQASASSAGGGASRF